MKPIPVILDTDIGTDIDDAWALAMLLNSPELDLRLVTTCTGDTACRAQTVAKMLDIAGRTDIPIGVGVADHQPLTMKQWVDDYPLSDYPGTVHEDGVDALIRVIMESEEMITLISIGPLTTIAEALRREPAIAHKARFVGMQGSVRKGYDGAEKISAEYNVMADVPASRAAFTAPWPMTITPVDTCGLIRLRDEKFRAICDSPSPLPQAVLEQYKLWLIDKEMPTYSSVLFDTVAIYLAFAESLVEIEELGISISDDGFTRIDPSAKKIRCATNWNNLAAFEDLVVARITK